MASGSSIRPSSSRESVGSLIQQYFLQLTKGCGQEGCSNSDCATGSGKPLDPNQAAARAVSLAEHKRKGRLCIAPNSVAESKPFIRNSSSKTRLSSLENDRIARDREGDPSISSSSSSSQLQPEPMDTTDTAGGVHYSSSTDSVASSTLIFVTSRSGTSPSPRPSRQQLKSGNTAGESSSAGSIEMELLPPFADKKGTDRTQKTPTPAELSMPFLTETKVRELIERAQANGSGQEDYKELTNTIWLVFSSPDSLNQSFLLPEDSRPEICTETGITVDVKAVRRTYDALFGLQVDAIRNTMTNAMDMYCSTLKRMGSVLTKESLNHIVVLFENPLLHSPEFINTFPKFLQSFTLLTPSRKEALIRWYSHYPVEEIKNFVSALQQLITLHLLFSDDSEYQRMYIPQSDPAIASATSVMAVFFFANLIAAKRLGQMRSMSDELSSVAAKPKPEFMQTEDGEYEKLLCRLKVHPANALKVPIPFGEFLNEELNSRIHMGIDYQREYQTLSNGERAFSFLEHPFVLSTDNKVEKMFRDNLFNQYSERQRTLVHSVLTGVPDLPFLLLRIDRSNIVSDALVQLEAISDLNPIDLRKQLRVDFKGEEGIDEGGLQKEFFQLIIEQLFDPMNGMFTYDEDTQVHWFNPMSFESKEQYRLIGLLLGLAIYNNIILDIHFPMVIYHKLIGCNTVFSDLYSSHPQIARSLQSMLDYDGDPAEFADTYMASFQVTFADVFGHMHTHNLKEDGDQISVTTENCKEYVDLYTDWLLNQSIAQYFEPFKQGFDLVMGHSSLADLFRAEELELLICGSKEWDLDALEESTRYDGFTRTSPVIVDFWKIVREYSETEKKQLLAFITGSDRIPIGGLAKLKFIIVKNGGDSDRLPTAHTCFNALLLCDYSSKEKLRERLTKAISYAKGFGMI